VAIVGISCRFPGANNLEEFWKVLIHGQDVIRSVPEGRWTPEKCPLLWDDLKKTKGGFLNCNIEDFDAKLFEMSPKELGYMDPQQRLTLQVAWESLEDAGIDPSSLHSKHTGVFAGAWRQDYKDMLFQSHPEESAFFRQYMGNCFGLLSARISHVLGLTGPSITTESGCSSSIVAVHLACNSLLNRETDVSLACGVNLLTSPFTPKLMEAVLAPDFHCKTFDARADGFVRAEGCGVLVLKRYADAVQDRNRVYALIRGSAVVQEGLSKSLGTPTKTCESLAMKNALEKARVEPKDVSFVETHGTGTQVGDPMEVSAMAEAYYSVDREHPLVFGSVKANIGHTESCSGMAGIIKTVLCFQHETIPPQINFETLNPVIDLDSIPARIPLVAESWKRNLDGGKPRIAGVSSFGITGTDAHIILQEPPFSDHKVVNRFEQELSQDMPYHILALSAKSEEALDHKINQFQHFISTMDNEGNLKDTCYTANVGRSHFEYRRSVIGRNKQEILKNLQSAEKSISAKKPPKLCFLFTGQGSQYSDMGRGLYDNSPLFKMHFDECDRILTVSYGICIREAIWASSNNTALLERTIFSQTSIFVIEYCLLKLWESWGIEPDYVLGHSLGEFSAAVAAGILSFKDALKLVVERSRLIDQLPRGSMLVLKDSHSNVETMMKEAFHGSDRWLDFAAENAPDQTVLAGSGANVKFFADFCHGKNTKTHILQASHAFHSRDMDPILQEYREVASSVNYKKRIILKPQFVSGMDGQILQNSVINADYWVRHTRDRVRFSKAIRAVIESGCRHFLEIGPQPVLSALTMVNAKDETLSCLPSIRRQDSTNWPTILSTLSKLYTQGSPINWKGFYQFSSKTITTIPFYPFQQKPYWFELPDLGPGEIHPLLGTPLPNPSEIQLYSKKLNLLDLPYLQDHVIGNKVIFPGAAFLEMCLVAGQSSTINCSDEEEDGIGYDHLSPISVENFTIETPLGLEETRPSHLQVTVSSADSARSKQISIYSKSLIHENKWNLHASCNFSSLPVPSKNDNKYPSESASFTEIQSKCTQQTVPIEETYAKLIDLGLKFGPHFRTIRKMWSTADGSGGTFFEIALETTSVDPSNKYICHPALTDALFQAVMFTLNPHADRLHVPVSVKRFVCYSRVESEICFIHCQAEKGSEEMIASLYDSSGKLCFVMMGAVLLATNVASMLSALETNNKKLLLPQFYEDVWKVQLGPQERRVDPLKSFNPAVFTPQFELELTSRNNGLSKSEERFVRDLDRLCFLQMQRAIANLGLELTLGETYGYSELVHKLQIHRPIQEFFRYILTELAKEGILKVTDNHQTKFQSLKPLQSPGELAREIHSLRNKLHPSVESELVSEIGSKLHDILTGKVSALPYLFPETSSTNSPSAESYYIHSKMCNRANNTFSEILAKLTQTTNDYLQTNRKTVRILEVGAGTGSATKSVLTYLQKCPSAVAGETNWEYTYSDLSASFFAAGERIFENCGSAISVHYRILNIEEDPFDQQGFIPQHYDLIIANNVIHATKSVRNTMRNLRMLLRNDGLILIVESIEPSRPTVLTFGCLDGYWMFTDKELRPYNCEMGLEEWRNVLGDSGFREIVGIPAYGNRIGSIVARASSYPNPLTFTSIASKDFNSTWILFTLEDEISNFFKNKLQFLQNKVVSVTKSTDFKRHNSTCYAIRPDSESDFKDLFLSLSSDVTLPTIRGFIYLWGLATKDPEDYSSISKPYLDICRYIANSQGTKLYTYTRGAFSIDGYSVAAPTTAPIIAMTKCVQNENPDTNCRVVDFEETSGTLPISQDQLEEAFSELLVNDHEIYVAYRENQRHVLRSKLWNPSLNESLSLPSSERYRMILPPSKSINDLRFAPILKQNLRALQDDQIEVQVKSYGLNFRDVFAVLKPTAHFENLNSVGIDYSGIVKAVGSSVLTNFKIGDAVLGCKNEPSDDAMPSQVLTYPDILIPMPSSMTFNEGATLPAVASTAIYSLVQVANIKPNDTLLIHAGSGGVGLIAIQIAQHIGVSTIISTAGSSKKRSYLKRLGVTHVFHSRNTSFKEDILKALNGKGVDVVLNSLTGDGFKEASLSVCNEGARFVEMSKLNIWTPEEMLVLRPDIRYKIVDLSAFNREEMSNVLTTVQEWILNSRIRPLPYTRFDVGDVREALTYLQKAKHIGKVICTMSDGKDNALQQRSSFPPLFNDRSTYLVTGGLGGIGWEVGKWMLKSGAKHVALVGRKPPSMETANEIHLINSQGNNLFFLKYDIGDIQQCSNLLKTLKSDHLNVPPLRGIMHAAGVLSDASLINQTWDKYELTFHPKVRGGWNLHKLTLNYPLEHFVMFSSFVSKLAPAGQSNHCAANFFLDSLTAYRNSMGLPAITINWGQWGEVGLAKAMDINGVKAFTPLQGITALEKIMRTQKSQIAVIEQMDINLFQRAFSGVRKYLEDLKSESIKGKQANSKLESRFVVKTCEQFWKLVDDCRKTSTGGKLNVVVKDMVKSVVRRILKLEADIGDEEDFQELGLDSLMMIEMKNAVQSTMGKRVTVTVSELKDANNVAQLAATLTQRIIVSFGVSDLAQEKSPET
jgi:acyl transferase domain-containing protein/NADPH:quinone reductase-like Zn-dependent oxidoreductase/acyl carrier protein